ncbi:FliH/SctL family protein [Rhodohalobacter sp. 8-1]|uniref:FliH/SctL family protein n=1 Tax=Rhodohalobacter sp. 8-1 TaxID=3131972 RepID=UPI0030ECF656
MNSGKIINDGKITWDRKSQDTLSYRMLFDEAPAAVSEPEEDVPEIDVDEILRENNEQWEAKLREARQEAFDAGVEEGHDRGFKEAEVLLDQKAARLSEQLNQAHADWQEQQKMLDPGVLDLAFELAESILEIPVENPAIREKMKSELEPIIRRIDDSTRPVLWVSKSDEDFVTAIKEDNAPRTTINIRIDKTLNPGEFKLETSRESVVHQFKTLLQDLKESLNLPSWKA